MRRTRVDRVRRAAARWWRASTRERGRAALVLGLWVGAEGALRVLPLPLACRLFGVSLRPSSSNSRSAHELPEALEARILATTREVDRVLRVVQPEAGCLRRGLVLGRLLADLRPVLRIGVSRAEGRFDAHAWLEIDGVVIAEDGDPRGDRFVPLRPVPESP